MIEYALLFGLGFVTAALAGLLLAPAIHHRIVKFTEDRLLATVPVSPQELRAQKDMVRAEMATQVARGQHDLRREREKGIKLSLQNDELAQNAGRLMGENSDLRQTIETMDIEAGELRSQLRRDEQRLEQLKANLSAAEHEDQLKQQKIADLNFRIQRLTTDIDNLRIDLATRQTEAEALNARIGALRDERETLRRDLSTATQRAKDAELRLARETNKAIRLEDRLNTEIAGSVDKDTYIERRLSEIERLKQRLKAANSEARTANKALKQLGKSELAAVMSEEEEEAFLDSSSEDRPVVGQGNGAVAQDDIEEAEAPVATLFPPALLSDDGARQMGEDLRNQASAASELLQSLQDDSHDDALREEIADIAARMVAIVAQKEGRSSPIMQIISAQGGDRGNDRQSLAERASRAMHPQPADQG